MSRSERTKFYRKHSQTKNILVRLSGTQYTGSLLATRNIRITIREAALRLSTIAMLYKKLTTKDTLEYRLEPDRKSTRLNSSHSDRSRMPSSA